MLYQEDSYLRETTSQVVAHTAEGGLILSDHLFYPTGGGQPGDSGVVHWAGGALEIATTVQHEDGGAILLPAGPEPLPPVGAQVVQALDWERRYRHMRLHSALHLLSVVIPLPVTGGAISGAHARLDFQMPEPPSDPEGIEAQLNALVDLDLRIGQSWITRADLRANPEWIKTLNVAPPRGEERLRLVWIGAGDQEIDLQPCAGTHVARTSEVGALRLVKVSNKGKDNRRLRIALDS